MTIGRANSIELEKLLGHGGDDNSVRCRVGDDIKYASCLVLDDFHVCEGGSQILDKAMHQQIIRS